MEGILQRVRAHLAAKRAFQRRLLHHPRRAAIQATQASQSGDSNLYGILLWCSDRCDIIRVVLSLKCSQS
nr:unnamed protein product [Callosobruchus chinensis]